MKKRDLTSMHDLSSDEIREILSLAVKLKKDKKLQTDHLQGKAVGLVFQKPSNRTRVSFEVGVYQLGGKCLYLGPQEINLGKREATEDVAKTLSRYLDCIVARTFLHSDVLDLAKYATVPVINGLSDLYHPCQAFADILTIQEKLGKIDNVTVAYIGDGNNVCHSLMLICTKLGINIKVATPKGYEVNSDILKSAHAYAKETGAVVTTTHDPKKAAKGANVIYADVWTSMGQEEEAEKRLKDFHDYQINAGLVKLADPNYIFLHCLPAHRGEEVTTDIIDGAHSFVFDQAENRMHVEKAILIFLLRTD
jgi:ornithine carbamoyltransferase